MGGGGVAVAVGDEMAVRLLLMLLLLPPVAADVGIITEGAHLLVYIQDQVLGLLPPSPG